MAVEIKCTQLGVADCGYVARGETTGDALEDMIEHLDEEHDVELPEPDAIIENRVDEDLLDGEARVIVGRLQDQLNVADSEEGVPDVTEAPDQRAIPNVPRR